MTTAELLRDLHARDVRLTLDGDQLVYDAPESAITVEVLTLLHQHKIALLALLRQDVEPIMSRAEPPAHGAQLSVPHARMACPHQAYFPPTVTDGPTRQCWHCPHVWHVPCRCGTTQWTFVWQDGSPRWFCLACGVWYGSPRRMTVTPPATASLTA